MKATTSFGTLKPMPNCWIKIPGLDLPRTKDIIYMNILPDISDSKSAEYAAETIMGRAFPLKTYSHSGERSISWTAHFIVAEESDLTNNIKYLRALESCVYPREGTATVPYRPPPILQVRCGDLLNGSKPLCVVLKSYSVKFPTEVAWDKDSYVPYKFDIDLTFEVVYPSADLPGQEKILDLS